MASDNHHRSIHHRSIEHGRFILRTVHHRSIHPRAIHPRVQQTISVLDAFEELATAMPQHQGMDEFAYWLRAHIGYIHGRRLPGRGRNYRSALFPPASWNKRESATEGIARTTNICERWHNSLQSLLLCNHPSMWTFFDGIMKEPAIHANCQFPSGNCWKSTSTEEEVQSAQRTCQTCYWQLWTSRSSDILACCGSPVVVLNDKNSFW